MRTIIEGSGAPDFKDNPVDHFTLPIAYAELCPVQGIKIFSDPGIFVVHVLGHKDQWQALEGEDCGVSNFDHLFQANIGETLEIMAHTAYIKMTVEKDPVHFSVDVSNEAAKALSMSNGVKGHSAIIRSMVVDLITAPKDDNPLSSVVPMKKAVALRFFRTVGLDWLFSQGFKDAQVTFSN